MTSLPEDALSHLWRQMGENKTWSNFMKTVMGQCGRTENLDAMMVDYLVREAYDLKNINIQFPDSLDRLTQVLHERLVHA
jgi:hypothetical protein